MLRFRRLASHKISTTISDFEVGVGFYPTLQFFEYRRIFSDIRIKDNKS